MKIGILHITDIHFTATTVLGSKQESLGNVMVNDFHDVKKVYLILSGDIAFSGKKEEYSKAKSFIDALKKIYSYRIENVDLQPIIIPGNHDCDFSQDSDVRNTILRSVNYDNIGKDNSFIDLSLAVQSSFWGFYGFYHTLPKDKLFYTFDDKIEGLDISFYCLNTAWMSKLKEESGSLFFPVKKYEKHLDKDLRKEVLKIATWHHPINWFNPSTNENNKKEFQHFIESLAHVHFLGHEPEHEHQQSINKNRNIDTHLLSGKQFHDDKKPNESGFQTMVVDIFDFNALVKQYTWKQDYYSLSHENEISLAKETKQNFTIKPDFEKELNDLKIPLLFNNKKDIKLLEIFIFPDIEPVTASNIDKLESYVDSSRILESEFSNCVLDGDSQIGKSTLLSALFLKMYRDGISPILIKGEDFKGIGLDKLIKKALQKQYINGFNEFDRFMQLDPNKKVLLIDDYSNSILNAQSTKTILEEASKKFGKVIVTMDSTNGLFPSMQTDFQNWKFYSIKPLGYKKRNDLIESYHYLKEDPVTINKDLFIEETKISFDNVQSVLGNKLMPSYPIFILSILQALEYKPMQHQETSFGYCYQTLIHYSLNNAGIKNEYIDTYFNFLTELAYRFVINDVDYLTKKEYDDFYTSYKIDFLVPSFDVVSKTLIKSKIISEKDGYISFGYKYILYYLSAKKISDVLHKTEGKTVIQKLFERVHLEKNASILVFVTHHSKDISFIEESMMNSMIVLDKVQPITLFKDDPFYAVIQHIAEEVKHDVLEINKNPIEERRKHLTLKDESQRELEVVEKEIDGVPTDVKEQVDSIFIPFQQSFRSIEIVGQIIRNRKGSLTRKQLHEMTKEIYTTGFRTVGFVSELFNNDKNDIIASIVDESEENESKHEIETRINLLIQMISLQTCLGVFNKLTHSIGNRDLRDLYKDVAHDINNPAAKLVTFGINSYYGTIVLSDLKELAQDLKGNLVAMNLLKSRVKSYVYNKNLDYKTKQQIAEILGMSIGSINTIGQQKKKYN
jgi:hypothetical protein